MGWRAYVGWWDDDPGRVDVRDVAWEAARDVLREHLEPFLTDTCEDCRKQGTEALTALNALAPESPFEDQVDGDDFLLLRV